MENNREKIWADLYNKYGEEPSGETDFRSFKELFEEDGVLRGRRGVKALRGYDKGEGQFGSPDKGKAKELNFTYPKDPEDKLDLHGITREEATYLTEKFVRESREMGKTFVIIVVGMGRNSPDGKSKLRPVVVQKLIDLQNNQRLRDFKTAEPKDGGYGALYIYLR
jgi:hypothetical protein